MTLTGQEIKDLAEYAGFVIATGWNEDNILDHEFTVSRCPENGVQNDDGVVEKYSYVVTCDGCDGGECMPLGEPLTE